MDIETSIAPLDVTPLLGRILTRVVEGAHTTFRTLSISRLIGPESRFPGSVNMDYIATQSYYARAVTALCSGELEAALSAFRHFDALYIGLDGDWGLEDAEYEWRQRALSDKYPQLRAKVRFRTTL